MKKSESKAQDVPAKNPRKATTSGKYMNIPKEFDLSKYSDLRHLSDHELGDLLNRRGQIWCTCINDHTASPSEREQITRAVERLLINPLGGRSASFGLRMKSKDRIIGELVSEPSLNDLARYVQALDSFKQAASETHHDLVFSPSDLDGRYFGTISPNHMREVYPDKFKGHDCLVKVNLNARDDELIRSFEQLLCDLREIRGIPKPDEVKTETTSITRSKILRHQSIPYIDLMIWAKFHGAKIKTTKLSDALFPTSNYDSIEGARHIRERTDRYADKALSQAFIKSLMP